MSLQHLGQELISSLTSLSDLDNVDASRIQRALNRDCSDWFQQIVDKEDGQKSWLWRTLKTLKTKIKVPPPPPPPPDIIFSRENSDIAISLSSTSSVATLSSDFVNMAIPPKPISNQLDAPTTPKNQRPSQLNLDISLKQMREYGLTVANVSQDFVCAASAFLSRHGSSAEGCALPDSLLGRFGHPNPASIGLAIARVIGSAFSIGLSKEDFETQCNLFIKDGMPIVWHASVKKGSKRQKRKRQEEEEEKEEEQEEEEEEEEGDEDVTVDTPLGQSAGSRDYSRGSRGRAVDISQRKDFVVQRMKELDEIIGQYQNQEGSLFDPEYFSQTVQERIAIYEELTQIDSMILRLRGGANNAEFSSMLFHYYYFKNQLSFVIIIIII